ncbi:MAG: hydrogenase maturation protease [Eggerthellales bacterium]|nr:hydrogenase maturation protease [Eggerthellales bacterium]
MEETQQADAQQANAPRIAVLFVGNPLMLDDGVGPEVYERLVAAYDFPENVDLYNVGCMSMDMINLVNKYDFMLTVDAIEGTGEAPGTVFSYEPDDVARRDVPMSSLHELKLADLFDAAALLGYESEGLCLGMQVENASPANLCQGLSPAVEEKIPFLMETVVAVLTNRGFPPVQKKA